MNKESNVKNNGYQPESVIKHGYQPPAASSDEEIIPPPPTTDSILNQPTEDS
mgnify:CR=1